MVKNIKTKESLGGINITINDGILKPKNIISIYSTVEDDLDIKSIFRKNRYYVVQPGDTISSIAKEFGVLQSTIIWENNIKRSLIRPGQKLTILAVDGLSHKIKKNDTLSIIAKLYKANKEDIINFNNIKEDDKLKVGEKIVVPGGKKEIPKIIKPRRASVNQKNRNKFAGYVRTASGIKYPRYSSNRNFGNWTHPVPGSIRIRGITRTHRGVDMAAPIGTPILAAASGTVTKRATSGWNGGCGMMVYLRHNNGTRTLYCHASRVLVFEGDRVVKGQKIAEIGSTGNSTGPHLHFEIRGARNPF